MAPRPKRGARAEAPAAPRAEAPAEHRQAPRGRGPKVRAAEAAPPPAGPSKAGPLAAPPASPETAPAAAAVESTALGAASPEPRDARAPAEGEPGARGGGKRRGLGELGLRAFQEAVPELTLLPRRDSFDAGDIEDLSGLRPAQLRKLTQALPELLRAQKGRYSRQQVEQILRAKRLLEQGLAPGEIRARLQAAAVTPAPRPALSEARPPRPALPAAAPAAAPVTDGAALPPELLQQLRAELEALVALCAEDDEPAA